MQKILGDGGQEEKLNNMKSQLALMDKYSMPLESPISMGTPQQSRVPWEWAVKQGIQAKKVRSSTGQFTNLSGTQNNTNIMNGTITTSTFNNGTINNSVFQGTISQPVESGGTFTNPVINAGTFNNGSIGTSQLTGGTVDANLFKHNGTAGVDGTAIYVKTVDFIGQVVTLGTIITQKGIVTSIN